MKKRIEKSLPIKSNLTLDEQIYFINKTFEFLENVKEKNIIFNNVKYKGFMNESYGFFKETEDELNISELTSLKFNPEGIMTSESILEIINFIEIQKFNRLFTFTINKDTSIIKDNMLNNEKEFKNIIIKPKKSFSFKLNSSFLYLFRLNKKTLSKNTYIIIFEKYILIQLIRKKQKMLLYISI